MDLRYLLEPGDAPSKREILATALHLFVKDGLSETSIRAIGDRAGYTNPALYKFFPSKEALALHLFERCYAHIYERIVERTAGVPFPGSIAAFARAWCALMEGDLEAVLFVNENLRAFWPRVSRPLRRKSLVRYVAGLVAPGSHDADLSTSLLLGTCGQLARRRFFERDTPAPDPRALEALFLHGLAGAAT